MTLRLCENCADYNGEGYRTRPLRVSVTINRLDGSLDFVEDAQLLCHV